MMRMNKDTKIASWCSTCYDYADGECYGTRADVEWFKQPWVDSGCDGYYQDTRPLAHIEGYPPKIRDFPYQRQRRVNGEGAARNAALVLKL